MILLPTEFGVTLPLSKKGEASKRANEAPLLLLININGMFVSIPVIVEIDPAEQL